MSQWWNRLGLQARFMVIASVGVLGLALCTLAAIGWFEFSALETKLRSFSENELRSLNSLVESAMEQRMQDQQNVAIKVFNGWFESRNKEYAGKLWSVWDPKTKAYMARTAPDQAAKLPQDTIDEEALRTGQPIGRFVGDMYRYSLPIVLGTAVGTKKDSCVACHTGAMGQKDGDVLGVFSSSLSTVEDFAALRRLLLLMAGGALIAVLVVVAAIRMIFGRVITRRLACMTAAMRRLAEGDNTVDVPVQKRADEIAEMASAVEIFKQHAIENEQLQAQQNAERANKEKRQAAVEQHIAVFEQVVRSTLDQVASAAAEMRKTSQSMSATAEETNAQATAVAAAVEEVSVNMQTVASAAEQLLSSVAEIGRQVTHSTKIAGQAVEDASRTNATVQRLSEAAQKIGDVVKLITAIAEQTNLLALNATIEAARAGESGKGFAVVAAEVKNLANQTAKATDEIAAQVTSMQHTTGDAVKAIENITGTISTISEIAAAIAAAVEEQGAATQEITRNVQQAAKGANEVSSNITGVNQAAAETSTVSGQVLGSADNLGKQAGVLRADVDKFLANIRAA
jgi:methyl-accepting chemotaxis protein